MQESSLWAQSLPLGRQRIKVEVAAADAPLVSGRGGRLLADYGSFQLWEAPASQRQWFARQSSVRVREGDDVIELNAGRIQTAFGTAQAAVPLPERFEGKELRLVQFAGPIKPEWLARLKEQGWRIVAYVPRNSYLVYGDAQASSGLTASLSSAPHIQWEGRYEPGHKLHPGAGDAVRRALRSEATDDLFAIQLVDDPEANIGTLQLLDQQKRQWLKQTKQLGYVNCVLRLPADQLTKVAARPDVVSIQPYKIPTKFDERQGQILAGNLNGNTPVGPGYLAWLLGKGFSSSQFAGSGFVVDVTDSGIDNGSQLPGHFGLYTLGSLSSASRVVYNRLLGTPNSGSTIQGCDGHGNLNSHIIAGYNDASGFPHTDSDGYRYGLGISPFVRVGSSVIFDPDLFTFPDFAELQSRAYQDGARISCNSWGASVGGAYNFDSQTYDALVRDAQPSGSPFPAAGNQEMTIVFSAGNSGSSSGSMGAPGGAKNIISVGAAENVHSHSIANGGNSSTGADRCGVLDTGADSANDIIYLSSRGPCQDGRIKPDLMGPGTHVTGGVGQAASPGPNGTALACFMASGVCALAGAGSAGNPNNFFPLGQQFFTTSSGTSHSCPAIGGGAALLRQYFLNHSWAASSPAMTKAWLMNSARYLNGVYANDTLPSNNQGMGSMNLGMAFDGVWRVRRDQLPEDRFTAPGQSRTYQGFITDPAQPFRVTLAWTDAPGSTTGSAYNNDLNLTVTAGGQTYLGNVFSSALSVPGGSADLRNNVESVFLPPGLSGFFTVTVAAANIVSDGVPNNGDPLDQDFALLVYNGSEQSVMLVPAEAALVSESCSPGQGTVDPGETVTIDCSLMNLGPSNTTALVATLLPTGGVLSPSSPQNYGVVPGNSGSAVTRSFSFRAAGECGEEVTATLQLQDGTNDYGTVEYVFQMGTVASNLWTFTRNFPGIMVDASTGDVFPYPSRLNVSGVVGKVNRITVTLQGLTHSWPDDLDIVLVGPRGQAVPLLSDSGGAHAATNLTLVFDDDALAPAPDESLLASGTWKTSDYEPDDPMPGPAPARPYATSLGAFAGTNPNGLWRLFVEDDYPSDDGGGIQAWTLTIGTTNAVCCQDPGSAALELNLAGPPSPVSISNIVTYTLTVSNRGPATAQGVTLVDTLASGAVFLNATLTQGTYSEAAGIITCNLGLIPAAGWAKATITAQVVAGPELSNDAVVSAVEPDPNPADNQASLTTAVLVPHLTLQGTSVVEGDSGNSFAVFLVALSQPPAQTVTVDFFTADGTATSGLDYVAQSNRLTFLPGEISKTLEIQVLTDTMDEIDETFQLFLTNAVNAALSSATATGTILDDDPAPAISISDAGVVEGNSGTTGAVFTVSLSAASGLPVTATYSTLAGTAQSGSDFLAAAQLPVALAPGQATTNIIISVYGDTQVEGNETFSVQLANPTNAVLGRGVGLGSIIADDFAPVVSIAGYRLVAESGGITNGIVDAGETVTVSLALVNEGSSDATNLTATLLVSGGVISPTGPQNYGVLRAGGPQVSRLFTFTVGVGNCDTLTLTVSLQDVAGNLGTAHVDIAVGECYYDDFEPDIDLPLWSGFGGILGSDVIATNYGGSISGSNALWFGGNSVRQATTRAIDTSEGGHVAFYLRLSNGGLSGIWERVDVPAEGVVIEASIDNGSSWMELGRFDTTAYYVWTNVSIDIPVVAQTPATQFRWRQLSHSGACCDHWALDNVLVATGPRLPGIIRHPEDRVVSAGSSVSFVIEAEGSNPLAYQWWFNTNTLLLGETNATLLLTNVQLDRAGAYLATVSNLYGTAASSNAILTVLPAGACVIAPAGLVGWWRGETNTLDAAGTNNGAVLGGLAYGNGQVGQAFHFNGVDAGVRIPANSTLNVGSGPGFSIEGWIKPAAVNAQRPIVEWNNATGGVGAHFWISVGGSIGTGPGSLYANLWDTGGAWHYFSSAGGLLTTNAFQHVGLTYDKAAGVGKLYLNGAMIMQQNLGVFSPQTTYDCYLGHRPSGDAVPSWWVGELDEISIYNRALSEAEMQSIYSIGNGGKCPVRPAITVQPTNQTAVTGSAVTLSAMAMGAEPLFYQWRFNETDLSGKTNTSLTLTNISWGDAGIYQVVVSNVHGSATSSNATLVVNALTNLDITVMDAGWYDSTGFHLPLNGNYLCGISNSIEHRNWFVFSVPPIPSSLASAQLRFFSFGIQTPDVSETYALRHVATPVSTLLAGGTELTNIFDDLGDGVVYGSRIVLPSESNQDVVVPLNSSFLTNILNAAGGSLAIGGQVTSLSFSNSHEVLFAESDWGSGHIQLSLQFDPEPRFSLLAPTLLPGGAFELWLKNENGNPMTALDALRFDVRWTTNLSLPFSNWPVLSNSFALTNGILHIEGLNVSNDHHFYRARQIR